MLVYKYIVVGNFTRCEEKLLHFQQGVLFMNIGEIISRTQKTIDVVREIRARARDEGKPCPINATQEINNAITNAIDQSWDSDLDKYHIRRSDFDTSDY